MGYKLRIFTLRNPIVIFRIRGSMLNTCRVCGYTDAIFSLGGKMVKHYLLKFVNVVMLNLVMKIAS